MNVLSPLGWLYGRFADLRNALYDKGVLESHSLGARTISIGNITTGGTGKTPMVAYVAGILADRDEKVCILTRGYARENPKKRVLVSDGDRILAGPREAGDEPFELAMKLLGKAIVISDADRVAAAEWAKRRFGVTAFVLDDGFQHRRAKRDVDTVCIDATNPFGGGKMLPVGQLREPLHNLKRADVLVITRAKLVENIDNLKSEISELNTVAAIFTANNKIIRFTGLEEFHAKAQSTQRGEISQKALAFCGIGNPDSFFEQLRLENFEITATEPFQDHYNYTQHGITKMEKTARDSGAETLLTTAKDAVKLSNVKFEIPCFVVEIELTLDDLEKFASMI